ncbi:suppressor of fused domain protein [Gemmata sp. JC673]|uniref:Suppressor of fused domain protein n=1 Tax=Gemmata algarum TaxID=2975278 RepID=A0ABU5F845_9BACT|nr:suppressor of fused domain protein [Gemmata algarum]MDY3562922.1 suppressor of fused domain protein [Gemmata algarum]
MNMLDLEIRYFELQRAGDLVSIAHLLATHPEMVTVQEVAARMIHGSISNPALVALLVARGVNVNTPEDPRLPDRPLGTAVMGGYTETVRWLIEHGSDINYGWDGDKDYCKPLASAIRQGYTEVVRLLVEAGAYLNVLDRTNRTPLTWALDYGRDEIAAYLRSKGGVESHEVPGYVPPPPPDPVPDHVAWAVGPVRPRGWVPAVPDGDPPVAVRVAVREDGVVCLFTEGMSARPQPPGPGGEEYQYAELAVHLSGWPDDPARWLEPEYRWPLDWLRRLARHPFDAGTGFGGPVAVVANGDPPQPLGPGTALTCWLLLADKDPLGRLDAADGREVVFYELVPLHTAERDFEREHGTEALLERFAQADVPEFVVPDRPSVV